MVSKISFDDCLDKADLRARATQAAAALADAKAAHQPMFDQTTSAAAASSTQSQPPPRDTAASASQPLSRESTLGAPWQPLASAELSKNVEKYT